MSFNSPSPNSAISTSPSLTPMAERMAAGMTTRPAGPTRILAPIGRSGRLERSFSPVSGEGPLSSNSLPMAACHILLLWHKPKHVTFRGGSVKVGQCSTRLLEQLPPDQHPPDLAGSGADLVELGVAQKTARR